MRRLLSSSCPFPASTTTVAAAMQTRQDDTSDTLMTCASDRSDITPQGDASSPRPAYKR
jgi:hypothetical protein